jgi:hypothetical protein
MRLYARETYEHLDSGFSTKIHADLLKALKRRDHAAAIETVLKNAPTSEAVFVHALQSGDGVVAAAPKGKIKAAGRK